MKNAFRRIGPVILILVILAACAGGGWIWYDNNIDRSGWVEEDGVRFYRDFHADPVTGWLTLGPNWHYFGGSGAMIKGDWRQDGGLWFYLGEDGAMVKNTWIDNQYYVGADGVWVE